MCARLLHCPLIASFQSGLCEGSFLVDIADLRAIPDVTEMTFLVAICKNARAEHRGAFTACAPNTRIDDTVRPSFPEYSREVLSGRVPFGVIHKSLRALLAANVVKFGVEVDEVDAHIQMDGGLTGFAHKPLAMMLGLRDCRL